MEQKLFKVRDRRNKGWFYLDNEYLNGIGKHLGPIGIAVYVSLCRHADQEQKCFPSQEVIATEIGAGVRSVRKYIKKLEEYNIIQLENVRQLGGKWFNNIYYLLDKSEWRYPKATGADGQPKANDDTTIGISRHHHRQQVPTNNTHINNTNNNNTNIAKQSFADVNYLIDLFKEVNPSYKKFFSNKTQREAMERLFKQHGKEKIEWAIKVLPQFNKTKYAPTIISPLQLEDKLASLIFYIKKQEDNKFKIVKL